MNCPECGWPEHHCDCEPAKPGSLKRRGSASLVCDITSAVVNGKKLEGDDLRKWIEGMSEQDRRTMIEDMGLLDTLDEKGQR